MAIAPVQAATNEVNNASTVSVTKTVTGGNGVIIVGSATAFGTTSASGHGGDTYTKHGEIGASTNGGNGVAPGLSLWSCPNVTGGSTTFTFTPGGTPSSASIAMYEISGQSTSSWLDQIATFAQNNDGGNTIASLDTNSITTTNANDLLFAFGSNLGNHTQTQSFSAKTGGGTYTITSGGSDDSTTGIPIAAATQVVSATGTYAATYSTDASTEPTTCCIAAFKAAAAGGGGLPWPGMGIDIQSGAQAAMMR